MVNSEDIRVSIEAGGWTREYRGPFQAVMTWDGLHWSADVRDASGRIVPCVDYIGATMGDTVTACIGGVEMTDIPITERWEIVRRPYTKD